MPRKYPRGMRVCARAMGQFVLKIAYLALIANPDHISATDRVRSGYEINLEHHLGTTCNTDLRCPSLIMAPDFTEPVKQYLIVEAYNSKPKQKKTMDLCA